MFLAGHESGLSRNTELKGKKGGRGAIVLGYWGVPEIEEIGLNWYRGRAVAKTGSCHER